MTPLVNYITLYERYHIFWPTLYIYMPVVTLLIRKRPHSGSQRHADPRRQQQHTAVAAHVTIATVRPWRFSWPCGLILWPFDLWINACRAPAIEYAYTKFGVDSSSPFLFRARINRQTNRQTRLNAIPTPATIRFVTWPALFDYVATSTV